MQHRWIRVFAGVILLATVLSAVVADSAAGAAADLKVMSFNVRYSKPGFSETHSENNWNDPAHPRRERAIRVIRDYDPDVLGVQEARELQIKDLQAALTGYEFYGVGRDNGKMAGEFSGIFYRGDRFRRIAEGSFWLSASPETPGTTFHSRVGAPPRIASWVKLADRESGREMLVLNMHWDNEGEPARQKSAALVRARLAPLSDGLPTIVMGDLNATEETPEYKTLLGGEEHENARLFDSFRRVNPTRGREEASYNDWKGTTTGSRIDFILHSADLNPAAAAIVRTAYDGRWPSDHYPVTATLQVDRPQ